MRAVLEQILRGDENLSFQRRGAVAAISAKSARICSLRSRLSASVSRSAARMRSQSSPISSTRRDAGRDVARVSRKPVVELAMEGPVGLIARAPADRVGEPGDRARIGARQAGDDRIDQRADPFRFRARGARAPREPIRSARLAAAAIASRPASLHGGPRPIAASTISSSRQRIEPQTAAARADRGQDLTWPMRDDEDQRSLRRLLNHFQ